jgi:hypothetical protein
MTREEAKYRAEQAEERAIAAERRWVAMRCADIADELAAESVGAGFFSATIERRWMGRRIASAIRDEFGLEEK